MATYPTSTKTFTSKTNAIDTVDAAHINAIQDEITAVEADLLSSTPTYITKVTTGINAAAISTGTLADGRISGTYTNLTANNSTYAFGKSEVNLNVNSATQATNATNLNSQPGSYYTNASNLNTGTLPLAQLHANVLLTTSTTGINASALSTGTVPSARLSGAYTGLTAITVSNTATVGRTIENFQTISSTISGTPTVTFDCTTGNLWNVTGTISSNWTANFTNLGLANSYATAVTLIVQQGASAYLPTAVQIEGNAVTLTWQGSTQPTPVANKKDVFAFNILQTGTSTYVVLGQHVSF